MTVLTVIEPDAGNITRNISQKLPQCGGEISVSRALTAGDIPAEADILVVSPCNPRQSWNGTDRKKPHCRLMLLPDGYNAGFARADCVVTYGMNTKNTLTLSSIGERGSVLSLQRELMTAAGVIIERQEFCVSGGGDVDELLAVSGALLLLGIMPDSFQFQEI